jgi:hypothetical protein
MNDITDGLKKVGKSCRIGAVRNSAIVAGSEFRMFVSRSMLLKCLIYGVRRAPVFGDRVALFRAE